MNVTGNYLFPVKRPISLHRGTNVYHMDKRIKREMLSLQMIFTSHTNFNFLLKRNNFSKIKHKGIGNKSLCFKIHTTTEMTKLVR